MENKKPKGFWNKENCLMEARKYNTRKDWQVSSGSSYVIARKNGWLEDCCIHMIVLQKKWTKAMILEEALKYQTRTDWIKNGQASYSFAVTHKLLDEATRHMTALKKPNGSWSKAECILEAKKFKTKTEWRKKSASSYVIAKRNGWLDECSVNLKALRKHEGYSKEEILSDAQKYKTKKEWRSSSLTYFVAQRKGMLDEASPHMLELQKPSGFWSEKRILQESLKYQSIKEWLANSAGSYQVALKNKLIPKATSHMPKLNISYGEYLIHKYLLSHDISYEAEKSFSDLKFKSTLFYDFYLPEFKLVIEFHGEQHYQYNKHWHKNTEGFNIAQAKDKIKEEYLISKNLNLLVIPYKELRNIDEIISKKLLEIASKFSTQFELVKRELSAVEVRSIADNCKWNKESVMADAKQYTVLADWRKYSKSAYTIARKNGWLEDAAAHLIRRITPRTFWTKEMIIAEAKKYMTRSAWSKASTKTYKTALLMNWDVEACSHMKGVSKKGLKKRT